MSTLVTYVKNDHCIFIFIHKSRVGVRFDELIMMTVLCRIVIRSTESEDWKSIFSIKFNIMILSSTMGN